MAQIIDLQRGQLLRLDATRGDRVQVLFGTVWLTEPRRLDDVFAASGEEVVLDHGGRVLLEAQGFARVIVSAPKPRPTFAALVAQLRQLTRHSLPAPTYSTLSRKRRAAPSFLDLRGRRARRRPALGAL